MKYVTVYTEHAYPGVPFSVPDDAVVVNVEWTDPRESPQPLRVFVARSVTRKEQA